MNNVKTGSAGEDLAVRFLKDNGYEIIDTNIKFSRFCEIDIVAKLKNTLVFVEVKTRKSDAFGTPAEAITKTKYQNIKKGVYFYLQDNKIKYDKYRIDLISITLKPELKIEHIENICYG